MRLDVGEQCGGTEDTAHVTALDLAVSTAARTPAKQGIPLRELFERGIEIVVGRASAAPADLGYTVSQVNATPMFHL
jgi:hypothetical protein